MTAGKGTQETLFPSHCLTIAGTASPSEMHLPMPRDPKAGGETPITETEEAVFCPGPSQGCPWKASAP